MLRLVLLKRPLGNAGEKYEVRTQIRNHRLSDVYAVSLTPESVSRSLMPHRKSYVWKSEWGVRVRNEACVCVACPGSQAIADISPSAAVRIFCNLVLLSCANRVPGNYRDFQKGCGHKSRLFLLPPLSCNPALVQHIACLSYRFGE